MNKYKRVSLPEGIVCYYLKQLFIDLKESYRASWLGRREIDMFIPSLNLGIEYDGQYFHSDIQKDKEKDDILFNQGIKVVRIREPDCPILTDGSYTILISKIVSNYIYLEPVIYSLVEFINQEYGLDLEIDVDIRRDREIILEEYKKIFEDEDYGKSNRTRNKLRRQAREEKETRILTLYNSGLTQEQVAKEVGCTAPTVIKTLKKYNINRKEEHIRQIQLLKAKRFKQKEVAETLGIGIATVRRHWNKVA